MLQWGAWMRNVSKGQYRTSAQRARAAPTGEGPLPIRDPYNARDHVPTYPPIYLHSNRTFRAHNHPRTLSCLPNVSTPLLRIPCSSPYLRQIPTTSTTPTKSTTGTSLPTPNIFPIPPKSVPLSMSRSYFSSKVPLLSTILFQSSRS